MLSIRNLRFEKGLGIVGAIVVGYLLVRFWPNKSLNWHDAAGHRWATLPALESGGPGFTLLPHSKTGITFSNLLTQAQIVENRFLLGGSGVATGDIDGDELIDVYFCALDGSNVLYRNLGNWKFEDITEEAGVACPNRFATGATFADLDGDFDLDLLVTAWGGPNACFLNDGSGRFSEVTNSADLQSTSGSTSMALADIDADGDLDLYIANYKRESAETLYSRRERAPGRIVRQIGETLEVIPQFKEHYRIGMIGDQPVLFETAEPDFLYLNDGSGRFHRVSFVDGRFLDEMGEPAAEPKDWGLMVRLQDMDDDRDPDIYVGNDYWSPDRIWINDGTGHFQAIDKLAIRHTSKFTMGMDFSDIDRDGDLDFLLIDMLAQDHQRRMQQNRPTREPPSEIGQFDDRPQVKRNTLFLNRGDLTYAEIGQFSGIQASDWTWSVRFLDVDLDGYEDVIATNGQLHDLEDADTIERAQRLSALGYESRQLTTIYRDYSTPNVAFRNRGELSFENHSAKWGFTEPDISWGMAMADFDNDGDLDLAINRLDEPAGIYRNNASAPRIAVRLKGLAPNTQGIGAKIKVEGGPVPQRKDVICGGTYLSGSDPLVSFAVGDGENRLTIEVLWQSGRISRIEGVIPNRIYDVFESYANCSSTPQPDSLQKPFAYFEDVSHLIDHEHHEDVFDDFDRQPLLPFRLSQLGPGVSWHDIDSDGDDDLIIASGKGGTLACLSNKGEQGFSRIEDKRLTQVLEHDQTSILGWKRDDGRSSLLVGCSNYESARSSDAFVLRYDFENHTVVNSQRLAGDRSSTGPMALADYDGDGDLDLFVGGRTIPARFPEPASSLLYRNQEGTFSIDETNSKKFNFLGMVSGAVFSDIDSDGDPDLILALQLGPVMVLRNTAGHFVDATSELGLDQYKGWWNGVTTGDLNEDGHLDIIATNWGSNSAYPASMDNPLHTYYSDFDGNGSLDIIEAHYNPDTERMVPERSLATLSKAIPYVASRMPSYRSYAAASVDDIIGKSLTQAHQLLANTVEHMLFLNRGDRFEAVALPKEAQFAPAFYAGVADFDGDGHDDIFLSQNFFALPDAPNRFDAGRGLWLKGDGTGELEAIPGQTSGVKVYGEQRGAALSDYNRDGRVDLVVTQNGAATRLFKNRGAAPGLRVKLNGPKHNPSGIGAVVRIVYTDGYGPARAIHAGSGYWSQNSAVQVLGLRSTPAGVRVQWPGGKITEVEITPSTSEIILRHEDAQP